MNTAMRIRTPDGGIGVMAILMTAIRSPRRSISCVASATKCLSQNEVHNGQTPLPPKRKRLGPSRRIPAIRQRLACSSPGARRGPSVAACSRRYAYGRVRHPGQNGVDATVVEGVTGAFVPHHDASGAQARPRVPGGHAPLGSVRYRAPWRRSHGHRRACDVSGLSSRFRSSRLNARAAWRRRKRLHLISNVSKNRQLPATRATARRSWLHRRWHRRGAMDFLASCRMPWKRSRLC